MQTASFTTATSYPAQPQIGPNPASVRIDLVIGGPVIVEIWQGAHGQAQIVGETEFAQSVQIAGATAIRVKDATAGTSVVCQATLYETKDPLPSFVAAGATQVTVPSGALIGVTVITATGAGTYTPPVTATSLVVEGVAAGAGGGGTAVGAAANTGAGGGGAGAYFLKRFTTLAASYAYSIGVGGTGGTTAPGNGVDGGNTTFDTITASGGHGGTGAATGTQTAGGLGDVSANGDLNVSGGDAQGGANSRGGVGGSSFYGGGGTGGVAGNVGAGRAYGSGGGGGTGPSAVGGAGKSGLIVVSEYA